MTDYDPSQLVPHPRYGSKVRRSAENIDAETVRGSFWRYSLEKIFPESAIKADVSKQNYSIFARPYYVDVLMTCEDCKRDFLFFAEEQKYWHEELGFYVDAWCVRCCECRKKKQGPKAALRTYSDLVSQETLTSEQLQQLVTCAVRELLNSLGANGKF